MEMRQMCRELDSWTAVQWSLAFIYLEIFLIFVRVWGEILSFDPIISDFPLSRFPAKFILGKMEEVDILNISVRLEGVLTLWCAGSLK